MQSTQKIVIETEVFARGNFRCGDDGRNDCCQFLESNSGNWHCNLFDEELRKGATYPPYGSLCRDSRKKGLTVLDPNIKEKELSRTEHIEKLRQEIGTAKESLEFYESHTQEDLDELEQEHEAERAFEMMVEESRKIETEMIHEGLADIDHFAEDDDEEADHDTDVDLGYLEDDECNGSNR